MSRKWTSWILALALVAAVPVQPLALSSLREQEAAGLLEQSANADSADAGENLDTGENTSDDAQAAAQTEDSAQQNAAQDDTQQEQPAVAAQAAGGTIEALLNSAPLGEPVEPTSDALDGVVESVLETVVTDDMLTYDKVKACYDYITSHTSYGDHMAYMSSPIGSGTCWDVYQSYGEVEGFGAVALTAGKGMCNAYASAFILMVRHLGLDAKLVKGYTLGGGGGYAYHEWAEVTIDGTPYVFDPQLEQDLVKSGMPPYSVFCKSYATLGRRYQKA